jgi:DNA-binding NarL/FixJ family response regulator
VTKPAYRALIVEDDTSWQQIMSEIIVECGLEVDVADSLSGSTPLLKKISHRLAVVDLSLSPNDHNNVDGLLVLDNVRRLDPNCRTILLTGFSTVELAVSAITEYGAFTFIRKESFQRSQFKEIVHRILVSAPPGKNNNSKLTSVGEQVLSPKVDVARQLANKALLVEDDAGWRSILEDLIIESGFESHSCTSFGEAIGLLRRDKFSIAVLDLSLNEIDGQQADDGGQRKPHGYQLLEITKANRIATIVVSGLSQPEEIKNIYSQYSISAYFEKQSFDRAMFNRILLETSAAIDVTDELSVLTEREREVLNLLAQGLVNKEIADRLVISTNTVKRHLKAIFEKLQVHTRSAATAKVTGGNR